MGAGALVASFTISTLGYAAVSPVVPRIPSLHTLRSVSDPKNLRLMQNPRVYQTVSVDARTATTVCLIIRDIALAFLHRQAWVVALPDAGHHPREVWEYAGFDGWLKDSLFHPSEASLAARSVKVDLSPPNDECSSLALLHHWPPGACARTTSASATRRSSEATGSMQQ
ncbi:hypothetical protein LXA43DRAFT_1119505 [Ganoderma leucocontextum]|nr:hypothetical protein LXA43DRAFT_1119505 [Ganoderma leucocontextum]